MFSYIARKILWGVLTVTGVMILTFVLFRVAAGDPASTLAGKNPKPDELESLRASLGSDKPLFYGNLRRTELYTNCDFKGAKNVFRSVEISSGAVPGERGIIVNSSQEIVFKRNFEPSGKVTVHIRATAPLKLNGRLCKIRDGLLEHVMDAPPERFAVSSADGNDPAQIESVEFYRHTENCFDSQFVDSIHEFVSFKSSFPYVSFFNFGKTLQSREEIRPKLWRGMFVSLSLMLPVFAGELLLGIVLAMAASVKRGSITDRAIMIFSIASMSISYLALIIFGQWFFAYYLNLFPVWGYGGVIYLILPVAVGIVSGTGGGVRFYRTIFLNEMNREYLRTATAKGLSAPKIYFKHLLSNALVPIITRASSVLPFLFTGSLLLESFFGIPGLGYEGVNALNDSDLQMLKAIVLLSALMFVIMNAVTDIICAWADPRIRIS